jgi:hypothetical protein
MNALRRIKQKRKQRPRTLRGTENPQDHPTVIGLLGSFFIPFAGGIAYYRIRDKYPKAGKAYGTVSLISFCLIIVSTILNTTPKKS